MSLKKLPFENYCQCNPPPDDSQKVLKGEMKPVVDLDKNRPRMSFQHDWFCTKCEKLTTPPSEKPKFPEDK